MKKTLFALVILFIANIACKKITNDGNTCACSPMRGPELYLSVKSSAGVDLLNSKNTGAYTKDQIQFYQKDVTGKVTQLTFFIREPFSYGDNKFSNYSLYAPVSFLQSISDNIVYLKLNQKEYKLNIQLAQTKADVDQLKIDDKTATKDTGNLSKYLNMFYLTE